MPSRRGRTTRCTAPASPAGASTARVGAAPARTTSTAGARSHCPRHGLRIQVAAPRGGAGRPHRALELCAQRLGAASAAGDVVAHVGHHRRPRRGREQVVEGQHAPGLGGRHDQAAADVVEGAAAHPADAVLHRVQRRQQQVPLLDGRRPAARGRCVRRARRRARRPPSRCREARAARRSPRAPRRSGSGPTTWMSKGGYASTALEADRRRLELRRARLRVGRVDRQVVGRDLVREMQRHEGEAGAQAGSMCTGATTRRGASARAPAGPRRSPRRAASSGETSMVSPRRIGDW